MLISPYLTFFTCSLVPPSISSFSSSLPFPPPLSPFSLSLPLSFFLPLSFLPLSPLILSILLSPFFPLSPFPSLSLFPFSPYLSFLPLSPLILSILLSFLFSSSLFSPPLQAFALYGEAVSRDLLPSVWQRSLYNEPDLRATPWWTTEDTGYSSDLRRIADALRNITE